MAGDRPKIAPRAGTGEPRRPGVTPTQLFSGMTTSPIPAGAELATLGGGCFWCTEAVYNMLEGVYDVRPGYSGGHVAKPTYEQVCGKKTGHAEVVQIAFDPNKLSYRDVLEVFFASHDPTTKDRQGNDTGPQYRSAIFTHSDAQRMTAESVIREFGASGNSRCCHSGKLTGTTQSCRG